MHYGLAIIYPDGAAVYLNFERLDAALARAEFLLAGDSSLRILLHRFGAHSIQCDEVKRAA